MPSFPLPRQGFLVAVAASMAVAAGVALDAPQPAGARERTFLVQLSDGTLTTVTLDVPDGTPLAAIPLPGTLVKEETLAPPTQSATGPSSTSSDAQQAGKGSAGSTTSTGTHKRRPNHKRRHTRRPARPKHRAPLRNRDGSPTPHNPTF